MTAYIIFSSIGVDAGPFNLYSDVDGYSGAFAVGVSRTQLLSGYPTSAVPDGTTIVRAKSFGICTNFLDMSLVAASTTTTTTTLPPSTTTTTTLPPVSTTTTSTTLPATTTTTSTAGPATTTTTTTAAPTTTTTSSTVSPYNANLTLVSTGTTACGNPLNTIVYFSTDVEGTHVWTDPGMTVPFNSGSSWFRVDNFAYKTSGPNGVIVSAQPCE